MKDGLYRVENKYLCAGFVIRNGQLAACAPILLDKFFYWKTVATLIKEDKNFEDTKCQRSHM